MYKRPPRERLLVTSFTIERAQYEWLQREALRLTHATQSRVGMSDIIRAVIAAMMEPKAAANNAHTNTE
jgi:hypothetical protein